MKHGQQCLRNVESLETDILDEIPHEYSKSHNDNLKAEFIKTLLKYIIYIYLSMDFSSYSWFSLYMAIIAGKVYNGNINSIWT